MIETSKTDIRQKVGALLIDLSKAFDCRTCFEALLMCKCEAYGMSNQATKLLQSYLEGRTQRVKIGCETSSWQYIVKGVPQGSILGQLC